MLIAALFTVVKTWKQSKCPPMDERIKKMWSVYTMGYCSAVRKDEILPSGTTWMNLENIMLSKISQTKKDENHMISLIGGIKNRKQQISTQNELIDTDNRMVVTKGDGRGGGREGKGPSKW